MKAFAQKRVLLTVSICILANLVVPCVLRAQLPLPASPPATPAAQLNALSALRAQANWFRNATQTAPNYPTGNYDLLWQQFQLLRRAYTEFKATLTPKQLASGANELAELDAGLDILQEAFDEYQQDVAARRSPAAAFKSMCQVLNEAAALWLQELNKAIKRLSVRYR